MATRARRRRIRDDALPPLAKYAQELGGKKAFTGMPPDFDTASITPIGGRSKRMPLLKNKKDLDGQ
jgi:hypothetical protein